MLYTHNGNIFGDKDLSVIGLGCWNFGAQWNNKVAENVAVSIISRFLEMSNFAYFMLFI